MTIEEILMYIQMAFRLEITNKTELKENVLLVYLPDGIAKIEVKNKK